MITRNKTLRLPEDLYNRLKAAANEKNIDPVQFIEKLLEADKNREQSLIAEDSEVAPLYHLHEHAIDMGITDLAQNLDHYLYGLDKVSDDE